MKVLQVFGTRHEAIKIESELEYKPEHTFEIGLKDTLEWYLNNED
jgi:dTDP-D-glucose 4,6-dehydratase